jgi:hypothetical protein
MDYWPISLVVDANHFVPNKDQPCLRCWIDCTGVCVWGGAMQSISVRVTANFTDLTELHLHMHQIVRRNLQMNDVPRP